MEKEGMFSLFLPFNNLGPLFILTIRFHFFFFLLFLLFHPLQFDINQLTATVNVSQSLSPFHKLLESPSSMGIIGGSSASGSIGRASGVCTALSPMDRTKGFFSDESEPLLRSDSTSSKESALSRNGSFITKGRWRTLCGVSLN